MKKDPIEEQNDRIIKEWMIPIGVSFTTAVIITILYLASYG